MSPCLLTEMHASGAKAHLDSIGVMLGINPRSTTRTSSSASCLAPEGMTGGINKFPQGLKPSSFLAPSDGTVKTVPFQNKASKHSHDFLAGGEGLPRPSLRIGLNYVKGLRQAAAEAIVAARGDGDFASIDDLAVRVPELSRKDLVALAHVGALNRLSEVEHRRDALWQVEQAGRPVGPLLRSAAPATQAANPLRQMEADERLAADYAGTGITTGPHPMAWQRAELRRHGFLSAQELDECSSERRVRLAGRVICRQRPGTAKGFVFLSVEDETGIANVIIAPDLFEQNRVVVTRSRFLSITGKLQKQEGVVHVKALAVEVFELAAF
jgi:DNA polymerase III alpha subunit